MDQLNIETETPPDQAAVYAHGAVVVVLWRHGGRLTKRLGIQFAAQALPKPYLGTRISDDVAAVVALLPNAPAAPHIPLVIADADGREILNTPRARVRPLNALANDLGSPSVYEKLLARVLRHASSHVAGWTATHQTAIQELQHRHFSSLGPTRDSDQTEPAHSGSTPKSTPASDLAAAIDVIDGRRLVGWALDRHHPERTLTLEFFVNGQLAGTAVADNPGTDDPRGANRGNHGFAVNLRHDAFQPPHRDTHDLKVRDQSSGEVLIAGQQLLYRWGQAEREQVALTEKLERLEHALLTLRAQIDASRRRTAHALADYDLWFDEVYAQTIAPPRASDIAKAMAGPRFTVVVPLTETTQLSDFEGVMESVLAQGTDTHHRYIVCNQGQHDQAFEALFAAFSRRCSRLTWVDARARATANVLAALSKAAGEGFCLFLQPDERLAPDALASFADAVMQTRAKLLYADSDCIDAGGRHRDPAFRPDFNPDLLLSTPYIGAFAIDIMLLDGLAGHIDDAPDPIWQYDLLLRACEYLEDSDWAHVTRILTHLPVPETTPERDDGIRQQKRIIGVLQGYLDRIGLPTTAELDESLYRGNNDVPRNARTTAARLRWRLPDPAPRVSIIVPTRDGHDLVRACIDSINNTTRYPDYEILLVDNDSSEAQTRDWLAMVDGRDRIRVLHYHGTFNWSALNNHAAAEATGDVLCFLNNDTEVIAPDWLSEMVGHAWRADIGAVGAKLLFRNGTVQHGGVIVGAHGIAEHAFTGDPDERAGYAMRARLVQNLSAVTGACLVCRRTLFEDLGGFEMVHLGVAFNDVDFCLRAAEAGYRIVWTPHAKLYHLAGQSRGDDTAPDKRQRLAQEMDYMQRRWSTALERDPNYNPAFERHGHPFATLRSTAYPPVAARDTGSSTSGPGKGG